MSKDIITHITADNVDYPIGADAENIKWNDDISIKDVIGKNIDTNQTIDERLSDVAGSVNTLQQNSLIQDNKINQLQDKTEDLQNTISSADIPTLKTQIDQLKNKTNNLPVRNIKWDITPPRNLKDVLGNLDNMPYPTLRDWLESLEGGGGPGAATIWEEIQKKTNLKQLTGHWTDESSPRFSVTIDQAPCLCILAVFYKQIQSDFEHTFDGEAAKNLLTGKVGIVSTPALDWNTTGLYYDSVPNKSDFHQFLNLDEPLGCREFFYTVIENPGDYILQWVDESGDCTSTITYNYQIAYKKIRAQITPLVTTQRFSRIKKIASGLVKTNPSSFIKPANKNLIYFFEPYIYGDEEQWAFSPEPTNKIDAPGEQKMLYYDKSINSTQESVTLTFTPGFYYDMDPETQSTFPVQGSFITNSITYNIFQLQ